MLQRQPLTGLGLALCPLQPPVAGTLFSGSPLGPSDTGGNPESSVVKTLLLITVNYCYWNESVLRFVAEVAISTGTGAVM